MSFILSPPESDSVSGEGDIHKASESLNSQAHILPSSILCFLFF